MLCLLLKAWCKDDDLYIHRIKGMIPEDEMSKRFRRWTISDIMKDILMELSMEKFRNKDQKREFVDVFTKI